MNQTPGLQLHHIALRSLEPQRVAAFYQTVLGLPELRRRHDAHGLYSVWLRIGEHGILMVERGEKKPTRNDGWEFVAFAIAQGEAAMWRDRLSTHEIHIEGETDHTLYFRDPEGNRVGLSAYPEKLAK
jgi:glyoxylase I family protein